MSYPPFTNLYYCKDNGSKVINIMKNTHQKFPLGTAAELIDNSSEAAVVLDEGTERVVCLSTKNSAEEPSPSQTTGKE